MSFSGSNSNKRRGYWRWTQFGAVHSLNQPVTIVRPLLFLSSSTRKVYVLTPSDFMNNWPWLQASIFLTSRYMSWSISRRGFDFPIARQFSSSFANSRFRRRHRPRPTSRHTLSDGVLYIHTYTHTGTCYTYCRDASYRTFVFAYRLTPTHVARKPKHRIPTVLVYAHHTYDANSTINASGRRRRPRKSLEELLL